MISFRLLKLSALHCLQT